MGCWNKTCALTNIHITEGTEVYVFPVFENRPRDEDYFSLCHTTPFFTPFLMPFYAKYNDYGGGEETEGIGFFVFMDYLSKNLYEMEQGENPYHDIAVKKENLNEELFYEACHENRLYVRRSNGDKTYVNFVMIHKAAVDYLMENHELSTYMGDGKYNRYKFKDVIEDIDELISIIIDEIKKHEYFSFSDFLWSVEENKAAKELRILSSGYLSRVNYRIFHQINFLLKNDDRVKLKLYLTEVLKGVFIEDYMSMTRKLWIPQGCEGSQQQDQGPYRLLMKAMEKVLDIEKARYGEDYED